MEPDCSVKKRFDEIFGKYAACAQCGEKFVVHEDDWIHYTIICPRCKVITPEELNNVLQIVIQQEVKPNQEGE
jgi:phage FluMu protein Com